MLMKIQVSSGRVLANLLFEDHDALALFWRQYRNLFICQLKHLVRYISLKLTKPSKPIVTCMIRAAFSGSAPAR